MIILTLSYRIVYIVLSIVEDEERANCHSRHNNRVSMILTLKQLRKRQMTMKYI